jgi:hypothetical protein
MPYGVAGVAGANIANAVAGGIVYPAGGASPPVVPAWQPTIGAYVRDALEPAADTNYIGVDVTQVWDRNVLAEDYVTGWTAPVNDNAATGGKAAFVKSASVLVPTDKVTIAAGVATKDNAAGTHTVFANVAIDQYFWAVDAAST